MLTALRTLLVGAAAAVTVAALAACSPPAEEAGPTSLTLGIDPTTYGLISSPLDGQTLLYYGGRASYDSLLAWDPVESDFVPWLATEYEIGEDRKSISLTLRDDVDFIDGTHLDAQAVADFFELALASDGYRERGTVVEYFDLRVEAIGEYELEMTTEQPVNQKFLLDVLRDTGIASPIAAQDREGLLAEPVGTGPYLVDEQVPDVSVSYVRNPDYWNPEAFDFDELTYLVFEDPIAASNALKSGQIDATGVDTGLVADLESAGLNIETGGGTYTTIIVTDFAGEVVPALGDARVRQAINLAFDQDAILESLELGFGFVSDQPFPQVDPEWVDGGDDRYPYDPEGARELMAEAGYADGFDVVIPSANVAFYPSAYEPIVQQALGEIGIRVQFEQFADTNALLTAWASGAHGLILTGFGYSNTLGSLVGDTPLLGHFNDDPTFAELTTAINGGTVEESATASAELGEYILDEAWFVPLVHTAALWATVPEVDLALGQYNGTTMLNLFTIAE